MSIISTILTNLATKISDRVIDQAIPEGQPKDFNAGWRRMVSYGLSVPVVVYLSSIILGTTANAVALLFGYQIPHYVEFQLAIGDVSIGEVMVIVGGMLGWGALNTAHNAVINKVVKKG
jgi:hypothetical protein